MRRPKPGQHIVFTTTYHGNLMGTVSDTPPSKDRLGLVEVAGDRNFANLREVVFVTDDRVKALALSVKLNDLAEQYMLARSRLYAGEQAERDCFIRAAK